MISILLPTYQAAAVLSRSIRSILDQTFSEFELLVLDDGSTDDTEKIFMQYRDDRIRYIRLPHGGISAALNEGIRQSTFEVLARMDAGDIAFPERLQRQYDVLMNGPRSTIVSCRYAVFAGGRVQYLVEGAADPVRIRQRLALHPDFPHQGVMFRKDFVTHAGMYRDVPLEDYDLWLRVRTTAVFQVLPEVLMLIEHAGGSLTNSNVAQRYRDHYALQEPYFQDLSSFGITCKEHTALTKGWREYFYGTTEKAAAEWRELGLHRFLYPGVLAASLIMLLPEAMFIAFKEQRMRQRLVYLLQFFSTSAVRCRSYLQHMSADGEGA